MIEAILEVSLVLAAVGMSLIGGVFFAFSSFIMPALGRITPVNALICMQRINIDVLNWHFLGLFFGSGVLAGGAALLALLTWPVSHSVWVVIGAALYIFGTVFVTGACNVPLNNRLAALDPDSTEAQATWQMHLLRWTRWNHFRTVSAVLGTACQLTPFVSVF